jgi:hypothetical protein
MLDLEHPITLAEVCLCPKIRGGAKLGRRVEAARGKRRWRAAAAAAFAVTAAGTRIQELLKRLIENQFRYTATTATGTVTGKSKW